MATGVLDRLGEPQVVDLWPGGTPPGDDAAGIGPEKWLEPRPGDKWKKWLTNVTRPTVTIYRPPAERDTGAAALVCPGGGYHAMMWDTEGEEPAAWLTSLGLTGILLKYRCPRRPGEIMHLPAPGPLKDAQRAVSLVRARAKEWNLDPRRLGMIGFSAGGHLVAATATNFARRSYAPVDAIDQVSCRPDFGILAYTGYTFPRDQQQLSPTVPIVPDCPPLFFVHGSEDSCRGSEFDNSLMFCRALQLAGVSCELHLYAGGDHGFGVRQDGGPCAGWTRVCAEWLERRGVLRPQGHGAGAAGVECGPT